ncbi:MAG TPA: 4Fe-4S dicluster domain-containing protein [Nitrospirae bacterium]|nr:tetrathionate reductase subunit B precursor [bacterium BMS3Abin06]HDH11634.1 4Fe-4S dicluster domain-containing protein [Nitrospirota bacterium]HDL19777.1 4Fe-4S dicluster domain-containing protein [Nitrospirota bacterium]HDZ02054.1 4Fe-4S dicluster domain-containing protein [Nitrospirota bacterium]
MTKKDSISRRDIIKTGGAVAVAAAATTLLPVKAEAAKKKVPRWAMVVDLRKCIGCRGCCVADKSEYGAALGRYNTVVKNVEYGKYPAPEKHFLPRLCNHCAGEKGKEWQVPPCVEKCPEAKSGKRMKMGKIRYRTGATYKRPDGMILLDMSLCIGCYKCIDACPYGVRSVDPFAKLTRPDREKDFGVGKCTFCRHRVDKGIMPSCVNTCQGRARIFGDLNDPKSEVSKLAEKFNLLKNRKKSTLLPGEKTEPHVFYIDPDNVLARYKITKETKQEEFKSRFE